MAILFYPGLPSDVPLRVTLLPEPGKVSSCAMTVSCSKLTSSQTRHNHCGTCWACLVRRAALGAALPAGDPTVYGGNPWQGPWRPESDRQRDLAALRYWLQAPFDVATLAADIPVPASVSLRRLLGVLERGRRDLRDLDERERQVPNQ